VFSFFMTGPVRCHCMGPQSLACCVLTEEDVLAFLEVTVHKYSQGGVACCWNWSEVGHVLAELGNQVRWIHWVGYWS
jgi:hypothetical protein